MAADPHPPDPIIDVLERVVAAVRLEQPLSDALDNYAPGEPELSNAYVTWLRRRRAYKVELYFDADTFHETRAAR